MEKVRYTISDAAQMMDVESHALRYWEEELDLSVPRNEQGRPLFHFPRAILSLLHH